MKKLLSLFVLLVAIVMGAKAANEVVVIGSKNSGAFTIEGTSHGVAGYSSGSNSGTIAAADDGQGASAGSKMNSTTNIGSDLSSKGHVRFTVSAGETVRFYYYCQSSDKATTISTSDYSQSKSNYDSQEVSIASKNTLYYVDFVYENAGTYAISHNGDNIFAAALKFTAAAPVGPTITTQPQSASYVTGDEIAALTVEATPNTATFQWYSCDDANRTNAQLIEDETSASYTPTGAGFYYVAVTAGTTINSDVAQITVSEASAPTSATIESTPSSAEIGANVTLSITAMDGTPTPTEFKWYSCTDADKTGATEIEGETGNSYTFSKNTTGTYFFFANVKNSQGNVDSNVLSVTITKKAAGLAYATAVEKNIGAANFTNALTNPNELTVTYSVVDGATATGVSVDANTGEVTVGNVGGTATIKASFAGNDEFNAGEATYTLTVVVPDPAIQSANVVIAKSATGGNIAFTVGYHSAHGGVVTATTTADWITLGDVTIDTYGAGTVAFTNAANTSHASRFANVTLTYTYNTNETKTTTLVVAQDPELDGTFTIIKVPVQDATHAGEITGSIGGTATVALQTSAAAIDGGYKFGQNGNNITITLADSKTFQEGDVIIVHTTNAADLDPAILSMYSGDNMVLNTGTKGILGVNAFALPAAANDKTTIAVKRVNNSDYNWNGYVDYIEVVRAGAIINLNNSGDSFTKGFATYCSASNFTVTGATAYKATISKSKLVMTALEGIIPASTGVVLAGEKGANVTIENTTAAATADVEDNDLKGTTAAALTADLKGTADKFLAFKKSTSTFTPYGGTNFPANKAYLLLDSNNDSQSLEMVFDEATGINVVNASETEAQAAPVKVIKNGQLFIGNFNVAGQQVK